MSVLLDQGTGGTALALIEADRTVAAQRSWLSPLPPEGASASTHRSVDFAAQMACSQRIGVDSLCQFGLIDHVVQEFEQAAAHPRSFGQRLSAAIAAEISLARVITEADRIDRRQQKFQNLGTFAAWLSTTVRLSNR
ncbi:hypothetical protein [Glutamicibacter ardleyensis]|uniref:hypothetical protein n=1 Tax=Glutamicibacter ardleyensis TaxID=225894 RepID=UPI003FD2C837